MNKKVLIILIIIIVLIGGLYYLTIVKNTKDTLPQEKTSYEESEGNNTSSLEIGKEAPNFTLKNLDGKEVSLKDYRGKIVLINFWATWCKYCDIEMPDLQRLDNENDDLVVLAVDVMEDKEIVKEYIKKGGYKLEVALDEEGKVAKEYLVSSFPTSYFIDKDGKLIGSVPGMMEYPQMNEILENIREGK